MGGTNEKSNLLKCNIPMHAFLHKCLYEEHGNVRDLVAWRMLTGQITTAEARLIVARLPKSEEHKRKISESNKRTKAAFSDEKKQALREKQIANHHRCMLGRKRSTETIEKMCITAKKIAPNRKRNPETGKFCS